jgi:hypothetical protein
MTERAEHATKARDFIKEMARFAKEFDSCKTCCNRDQYRKFLLANQAWKCAEVHAQEATDPDVDKLMRKATRLRVAINKRFFRDCVEQRS